MKNRKKKGIVVRLIYRFGHEKPAKGCTFSTRIKWSVSPDFAQKRHTKNSCENLSTICDEVQYKFI
jgi:hypothetical protein